MSDIICAGYGGQGILTMGLILAKAALAAGKNVTWIPSYGSEMRGGTASCFVRVSEEEIPSPFIKRPHILIAMNPQSVKKYEATLQPGGILLYHSEALDGAAITRGDICRVPVPAAQIAAQCGEPRGANLSLLGALSRVQSDLSEAVLREAMDLFFAEKGIINPKNAACFAAGRAYAKETCREP